MDYTSESSMILYYLINLLVEKKIITKDEVAQIIQDIQNGGLFRPNNHPKIAWLDELMHDISYEEK